MANITYFYDEDDNRIELPTKWVICGTCDGDGAHSRHLGAMTQSDIDEWDPDAFEDYKAGAYDRQCETCDGAGKVKVADTDRMNADQLARWHEETRAEEEYEAEVRAEQHYFYGLEAY